MNALANSIGAQIDGASQLYHRLVLVVGGQRSGKTTALRELSESASLPFINLNLVLSQRLLELTSKARSLHLPKLLADIVASAGADVVILDNIEILFDPALHQDPLRCLQGVSRNRTIVASWSGTARDRTLTYAEPGHREYRRYTDIPAIIVHAGPPADQRTAEGNQR
jgi:hypothetical protein